MGDQGLRLSGVDGNYIQGRICMMINHHINRPTLFGYEYGGLFTAIAKLERVITTVHKDNINLSSAKKELVCWHCCLGQMGIKKVQFLIHTSILATSEAQCSVHTGESKLM